MRLKKIYVSTCSGVVRSMKICNRSNFFERPCIHCYVARVLPSFFTWKKGKVKQPSVTKGTNAYVNYKPTTRPTQPYERSSPSRVALHSLFFKKSQSGISEARKKLPRAIFKSTDSGLPGSTEWASRQVSPQSIEYWEKYAMNKLCRAVFFFFFFFEVKKNVESDLEEFQWLCLRIELWENGEVDELDYKL